MANTPRKLFFLGRNPKILVINNFERVPTFSVEFEIVKEHLCPWNVVNQKNEFTPDSICKICPVKNKEILFPKS